MTDAEDAQIPLLVLRHRLLMENSFVSREELLICETLARFVRVVYSLCLLYKLIMFYTMTRLWISSSRFSDRKQLGLC